MQLDDSLFGEIESVGNARRLNAGDVLVSAGDIDDHVHVVTDGEFVVQVTVSGADAIVGRIGRGALVGEISAIAGGPRTATVRAETDAGVITLHVAAFAHWLDEHEEQAAQIVTEARRRFDQLHAVETLAALAGPEDAAVATALSPKLEILRVSAGEVIFERGTVERLAYLVVSGRVRLEDAEGGRRLVGRHQFLGIDALFETAPRRATATALRETTLARLTRDDLYEVATSEPRALLLAARAAVAAATTTPPPTKPVNVALLVTAPINRDELVAVLHDEIAVHGRVIVLSSTSIDESLGRPGIAQASIDSVGLPRLNEHLHELEVANDHVLHLCDEEVTGWTTRALLQADRVLVVCSPQPTPDEARRINAARRLLPAGGAPLWLGVVHPIDTDTPRGTSALIDRFGVAKVLHARLADAPALRRWARLITGHGVGLVLSGGGARGFAHLGVHRALIAAGLPIDTIGGASIGGPVGIAIAMDLPPAETEVLVARQFHRLLDYTLPVTALLRGRRISNSIEEGLGGLDIEDVWIPFYCTSTNLTQSRVEVHRRGNAATAIRATVAIPGVLPPVPYKGDLLIDGGVLDNLPARQMSDDGSIGTVIAVDVAPPLGPRARMDYGHSMSGWRALFGRIRGRQPSPPIATVLMRSMLVAAILDRNALIAEGTIDLYLDLDLRGVSLLDFERVTEVARSGHELATPRLEEWLSSANAPAPWRRRAPERVP